MIYILKILRREENALSKAKLIHACETDQEFLEFMHINEMKIYDKENKSDLEFIEKSSLVATDNELYKKYLFYMIRESCEKKPKFVIKLIREYKLKKLLDDS